MPAKKKSDRAMEAIKEGKRLSIEYKNRYVKLNPFFAAYSRTGNISQSCELSGLSVGTLLQWRKKDPSINERMSEAFEEFLDYAEGKIWNRAIEGWNEPVYQNGEMVGEKRRYSDTLAIFMMKGHRPTKYRDNVSVEANISVADELQTAITLAMERAKRA